jgi:heptaprenyl diphosphate synthase/octaprenyl-diphosphate synthase
LKNLSIYEPIREDLPRVDELLQSTAQVGSGFLGGLLSYVLTCRGKRLRPALTLLAGKFQNYNLELLVPMGAAVELLHTATLVHDDTIDNSTVRRGLATMNARWDESTAVLVGDYLFAQSAVLAASTDNIRVVRLFAKTLMVIVDGELHQHNSSFHWQQSKEDYFQRIYRKTASLFSMATESGAILSDAQEPVIQALASYGRNLGMAFQIVDDVLDFMGEEGEMGKPVGSDLLQGTITLPAIVHRELYPQDSTLMELFENRGDDECARRAIEVIRSSPAIEESYRIADSFCQAAREQLTGLPEGSPKDSLISLTSYIVERNH